MQYFISFLEGIITFISPCHLPMLPIYISYFAGGEGSLKKTVRNALGFILGFTAVFVALGTLAGTVGRVLREYETAVNIVCGGVVIFFGLSFLGVFRLGIFKGMKNVGKREFGFLSSFVFGIVFSVSTTPCAGAFLGSALMMAATGGKVLQGTVMLLLYSLGLGIPFFISAILIDKLKGAFNFIKKHYGIINTICGIFLIIIGLLMITGFFGRFLSLVGGNG
ncbi:MAG: sulfite exporter TauE/SafE family protein [Clostridia bacterium]|nr:sulfite exporter TauE/SafE family protein [Clostridia bacterium]